MVANSGTSAASSTDGTTWTLRTIPYGQYFALTSGGGLFVAVSYSGRIAATSTNGTTWTQRSMPNNSAWNAVGYGS
jgi:hypothetical protein